MPSVFVLLVDPRLTFWCLTSCLICQTHFILNAISRWEQILPPDFRDFTRPFRFYVFFYFWSKKKKNKNTFVLFNEILFDVVGFCVFIADILTTLHRWQMFIYFLSTRLSFISHLFGFDFFTSVFEFFLFPWLSEDVLRTVLFCTLISIDASVAEWLEHSLSHFAIQVWILTWNIGQGGDFLMLPAYLKTFI